MKNYDKSFISQVRVAQGKKLITSRSIEEEMTDPFCRIGHKYPEIKGDLRHFGRCQRVSIIDYTGNDYTQDDFAGDPATRPGMQPKPSTSPVNPQVIIDLKHAPMIKLVDLSKFDRKPGSIITIVPKRPVRFFNVTVRVCDLYNRELVHDHAWDEGDNQVWNFVYFPSHKFCPDPGNLQITICASEKPRAAKEALVDVYELPVEKLREKVLCLN
jgi:hypothetical protein